MTTMCTSYLMLATLWLGNFMNCLLKLKNNINGRGYEIWIYRSTWVLVRCTTIAYRDAILLTLTGTSTGVDRYRSAIVAVPQGYHCDTTGYQPTTKLVRTYVQLRTWGKSRIFRHIENASAVSFLPFLHFGGSHQPLLTLNAVFNPNPLNLK